MEIWRRGEEDRRHFDSGEWLDPSFSREDSLICQHSSIVLVANQMTVSCRLAMTSGVSLQLDWERTRARGKFICKFLMLFPRLRPANPFTSQWIFRVVEIHHRSFFPRLICLMLSNSSAAWTDRELQKKIIRHERAFRPRLFALLNRKEIDWARRKFEHDRISLLVHVRPSLLDTQK